MKRKNNYNFMDGLLPLTYNGKLFERKKALSSNRKFCTYRYTVIEGHNYLNTGDFYVGKGTVELNHKPQRRNIDRYYGSSTDENFIKLITEHPESVKREILSLHENEDDAYAKEESILETKDENGLMMWQWPNCINKGPGGIWPNCSSFTGKSHSEETKQTIGEKNSVSLQGNQNAFGHRKSETLVKEARERTSDLWQDDEYATKAIAGIQKAHNKPVIFSFKNILYKTESCKEFKNYFGNRGDAWIRKKSDTYKSYGIETIRNPVEADNLDDIRNASDYPDIINEIKFRIKTYKIPYKNSSTNKKIILSSIIVFGFKQNIFKIIGSENRKKYFNRSESGLLSWIQDKTKFYKKYGIEFIRYGDESDLNNSDIKFAWNFPEIREEILENMNKITPTNEKSVIFKLNENVYRIESGSATVEYFQRNRTVWNWLFGKSVSYIPYGIEFIRYEADDDKFLYDIKDSDSHPHIRELLLKRREIMTTKRQDCPVVVNFLYGKKSKHFKNSTEGSAFYSVSLHTFINWSSNPARIPKKYNIQSVDIIVETV